MKKQTEQTFLMSSDKKSNTEDDNTTEEKQGEEASKLSTSFNYINSILGSGIIGMPYALKNAGICLGMLLFILVSLISNYTLRLMIRNGELSGSSSYQGVMTFCFGRPGFVFISIIQFIFPFLSVVGFNVGVGDTLSKVFGAFIGEDPQTSSLLILNRNVIIAVSLLTILLPLSLYKDIDKLAKTSFLSSLAILFLMISVFIRYVNLAPSLSNSSHSMTLFNWSGIPKAVGLMVFSYTVHHNSMLLYSSMKEKTEDAWAKVTHISISVVFISVVFVGVSGYFTFLDYTQGDRLENYCYDDTLINVSRVLFAMTLLLTGPIEIFIAREVLSNMIWAENTPPSLLYHIIITVSLVIISFILSLLTDCLGSVMEILGLYTGVPIAFILPALCYIFLKPGPKLSWTSVLPMCSIITGTFVILSGTILVLKEGMSTCSHGVSPQYCSAGDTL